MSDHATPAILPTLSLSEIQERVLLHFRAVPDADEWTDAERDRAYLLPEVMRLGRMVGDAHPKPKLSDKDFGFIESPCDVCGSFTLVRSGSCVTCKTCYSNSGCG